MKLIKKNYPAFFWIILLCVFAGTMCWELLERLLLFTGIEMDFTTSPVGFDIYVISLFIRINPGSIGGGVAGIFLFRWIR